MNLELFNNIINGVKNNNFVQEFMKELSNYLEQEIEKGVGKLTQNNTDSYREENCLYQVVDMSLNGVFLQNTNNDVIFEETNLSDEIKDKIEEDYVLRYKDGSYIIEQDITDDFLNSMIGISEYRKIKEEFASCSNILEIASDTQYRIQSQEDDYSILSYNENETIKVPNALIPYFTNENTLLCYKNGAFEKI